MSDVFPQVDHVDDNNNDQNHCHSVTNLPSHLVSNNNNNNSGTLANTNLNTNPNPNTRQPVWNGGLSITAQQDSYKSHSPTLVPHNGSDNLGTIESNKLAISKNKIDESLQNEDEEDYLNEKENKLCSSFLEKTVTINIPSKPILRGILKYPSGWRRRAFSEGGSPSMSSGSYSDVYLGTSLDSPEIIFDIEGEFEDDACRNDLPKKTVTFSEKMCATFVYRVGSSILGRRVKNQKRAKRKKEKLLRDSGDISLSESEGSLDSGKDSIEQVRKYIAQQRMILPDSADSTSDFSSSSGCDCSSTSECSGDELPTESVALFSTDYRDESKMEQTKSKRKNRRKRNRQNKQKIRTTLETGCYDSD